MRLFVAADLPESVLEALGDNLEDVKASSGLPARFITTENIHVTLAFLGDVSENQLPAVQAAIDAAALMMPAFDVELGDYGTFGCDENALLWQGFADPTGLEDLAAGLRHNLVLQGVAFDNSAFCPHVTLARKFDTTACPLSQLEDPWIDQGRVTSVSLVRSRLSAEGPTYEVLHRAELAKPFEHPDNTLLIIDADACPVTKDALVVARQLRVPVLLVGNGTQNLEKHLSKNDPRAFLSGKLDGRKTKDPFWVATMNVLGGADSADFQIATIVERGDVVVTQDFGVAAMALGAGARALGVRGHEYTQAGIDALMLVRHEEKKLRRQGGKTQGPKAFTGEDRSRFCSALRRMLESCGFNKRKQ